MCGTLKSITCELESTTHVHGLIDMQVHNYLLKCGGCYARESGTHM